MSRSVAGVCLFIAVTLLHVEPVLAAEAGVYRCDQPDGAVEFRLGPCAGDPGEPLEIRPQLFPGKQFGGPQLRRKKASSRSGDESGDRRTRLARTAEKRCWRTRKNIEKIERRLRQGYSRSQGERLRERRRDYEDYLRVFCR